MALIRKDLVITTFFLISTHFGMVVPENMNRNFLARASLLKKEII